MDKRIKRLLRPGYGLYYVFLLLFAAASIYYSPYIAAAELIVIIFLFFYSRRASARRRRELIRYIESISVKTPDTGVDSAIRFPLPMAVLNVETGEILWGNDEFYEAADLSDQMLLTKEISEVIPGFDTHWIVDVKNEYPEEVSLGDRRYTVYANLAQTDKLGKILFATIFMIDVTAFHELKREYNMRKPVVSVIAIDNYEELIKNMTDSERSAISAQIDDRIHKWCSKTSGMFRKFDRGKHLFIFEKHELDTMLSDKFEILAGVREIQNSTGIQATLSIGIGYDAVDFKEGLEFANLSLDMALSRGGDQAVLKGKYSFEFFGGQSFAVEKSAKVKSRVIANAFARLMRDSSQILIMGHKGSDLDSIGAAAGMLCAARKLSKDAYIVIDENTSSAKSLLRALKENRAYDRVFIDAQEALIKADVNTLLIVVDTTRPEYVESPELLESIPHIAVIDHHRRAANYIQNCAINMHEPYASSASELVCELLQYMVFPQDLQRIEAEALLSGIYLDTKGFVIKTGARTFEAAAYLRRAGADTVEVKKLFRTDIDEYMQLYEIVANANHYREDTAIAVAAFPVERAIAGKAADNLLEIVGVESSYVLFMQGDCAVVSARSLGRVNVQIVLEKLGGGGNITSAGVQIPGMNLTNLEGMLREKIDEYYLEQTK